MTRRSVTPTRPAIEPLTEYPFSISVRRPTGEDGVQRRRRFFIRSTCRFSPARNSCGFPVIGEPEVPSEIREGIREFGRGRISGDNIVNTSRRRPEGIPVGKMRGSVESLAKAGKLRGRRTRGACVARIRSPWAESRSRKQRKIKAEGEGGEGEGNVRTA